MAWSFAAFLQASRGPFRVRPEEIARVEGSSLMSGDNRPGIGQLAGIVREIGLGLGMIYPGTGGLIPPAFTTAQRDALSPLTPGELIWNTDDLELQEWNGTAWISVGGIPPTVTLTPVAGVLTVPDGLGDGSLITIDGPAATDVVVTSIVGATGASIRDRQTLLFRSSANPNSVQLTAGGNISLSGGTAYLVGTADRWMAQVEGAGASINEVARACGTRVVLNPDAVGPEWWSDASGGGSGAPANDTNNVSANIGNSQQARQFNNGAIDGLNFRLLITEDLVITQPLELTFKYRKENNAGNTGDAEFELLQAVGADGDNIDSSSVPEGVSGSVLLPIPVGDLNIMREGTVSISLAATTAVGDLAWIQLRRDATGGNIDDTFVGNIALEIAQLTAVVRRAGGRR